MPDALSSTIIMAILDDIDDIRRYRTIRYDAICCGVPHDTIRYDIEKQTDDTIRYDMLRDAARYDTIR